MENDWRKDLAYSRNNMIEIVWPKISHWFQGNVQLIQVEDIPNYHAELLDREAGIDYFVKNEKGLRPISARVQPSYNMPTLTFRETRTTGAKTEVEKLIARMMLDGYLYPWVHVQAYVDAKNCELLSAYGARVDEIFALFLPENENDIWERKTNSIDGNIFLVFWVNKLRVYGVEVKEYPQISLF